MHVLYLIRFSYSSNNYDANARERIISRSKHSGNMAVLTGYRMTHFQFIPLTNPLYEVKNLINLDKEIGVFLLADFRPLDDCEGATCLLLFSVFSLFMRLSFTLVSSHIIFRDLLLFIIVASTYPGNKSVVKSYKGIQSPASDRI